MIPPLSIKGMGVRRLIGPFAACAWRTWNNCNLMSTAARRLLFTSFNE